MSVVSLPIKLDYSYNPFHPDFSLKCSYACIPYHGTKRQARKLYCILGPKRWGQPDIPLIRSAAIIPRGPARFSLAGGTVASTGKDANDFVPPRASPCYSFRTLELGMSV